MASSADLRARLAEWSDTELPGLDDAGTEEGWDAHPSGFDPTVVVRMLQRGDLARHARAMVESARVLSSVIDQVSDQVLSDSHGHRLAFAHRFRELVDEWKQRTVLESSLTRMILDTGYQKIIGMGPPVLPLLLSELEREPDHWFWALTAITDEDPAADAETLEDATEVWLEWGRVRGYLD